MEQKKVDYEKVEQALALLEESGAEMILSLVNEGREETRNVVRVEETSSLVLLKSLIEGILVCGKEKGCPEHIAGLEFMAMVASSVKKVYREEAEADET